MNGSRNVLSLLETPRLLIRPFMPDDAAALFQILGDPEVMRFSVGGAHRRLGDTVRWIEHATRHQAMHGFAMCAVLCRGRHEIIGKCGLAILPDGRTEIGYRIRRNRWGRGYATEAAQAWLGYAFSVLRLSRVVAMIEQANHRSIRVAEKIGMRAGAPEIFHDIPVVAYFAEVPERRPISTD
jgi:[ribosomal protein S5]-alanine N-acetyltransferase